MSSKFFITDKSFFHNLAALAIPICLQQCITFGISFADNVMVGRLGEAAIGALYIGTVLQMLLSLIVFGISSASLILTTQYHGRGDTEAIKDVSSICMHLSIICSMFFSIAALLFPENIVALLTDNTDVMQQAIAYVRNVGVSYILFGVSSMLLTIMRSVEVVNIGLINSIIAFVINVVLNYIFIFGKLGCPKLGVVGAAYGTVIARMVETCVVTYYVFSVDKRLTMRLKDFMRWNPLLWNDILKYGTPVLLGQIVWALNIFGRGFINGHMSQAGIACVGIVDALDGMLWMVPLGLATATGIIIGKTIGTGEIEKVKRLSRTMQVFFLGIGIVTFVFILLIQDTFISMYKINGETVPLARKFLHVFAVSALGRCYQATCLMGLVKAGGDTSFVFKNDTFWVFCWVLPSAIIAQRVFHAQDWVVYAFLLSDQITKTFVAFVKINRYNWMKKLTH